jgi:hypothetical protein
MKSRTYTEGATCQSEHINTEMDITMGNSIWMDLISPHYITAGDHHAPHAVALPRELHGHVHKHVTLNFNCQRLPLPDPAAASAGTAPALC